MNRALSTIDIKSLSDDERVFEGIASTPRPDRTEDEVMPLGAEFMLPIPFLHQHSSDKPIGEITQARITKEGVFVKGHVKRFDNPGDPASLKERVDVAWAEIRSGLVRGLSIGFKPLEIEPIKGTYGLRFLRWLWLELSAVTVPANADASFTAIKSIDDQFFKSLDQQQRPQGEPLIRSVRLIPRPVLSGNKRAASGGSVLIIPRGKS